MYSEADLQAAVSAGALSHEAAEAFRAHAAGMRVVQVPDMVPSQGRFAHHLADDLLSGARAAGLI